MDWTPEQLESLKASRIFYLEWIADIEAGRDPLVTRTIAGKRVIDHGEQIDRYRRNVDEIEAILGVNGVEFDA